MKIRIVTPAARGTRLGNRVTAERWRRILQGLGHRVTVTQRYRDEAADVLVALHARRSHAAIQAFHKRYPGRPILVVLTGTDIYGDEAGDRAALESIDIAFRLIALQPLALRQVARRYRAKGRVIRQSFARRRVQRPASIRQGFQVAVIGHLRDVKDPLRTALAARNMPNSSRLRVVQAGSALQTRWALRAKLEMQRNPRYRWIGSRTAAAVARLMAASDLLVISSRSEGGANIVSEAIGLGLPVIASRVPGNVGLLGTNYPAYFKAGDTVALRRLLLKVERDPFFMRQLRSSLRKLVPRFELAAERTAWRNVLNDCTRVLQQQLESGMGFRRAGVFRQRQRRKITM